MLNFLIKDAYRLTMMSARNIDGPKNEIILWKTLLDFYNELPERYGISKENPVFVDYMAVAQKRLKDTEGEKKALEDPQAIELMKKIFGDFDV